MKEKLSEEELEQEEGPFYAPVSDNAISTGSSCAAVLYYFSGLSFPVAFSAARASRTFQQPDCLVEQLHSLPTGLLCTNRVHRFWYGVR